MFKDLTPDDIEFDASFYGTGVAQNWAPATTMRFDVAPAKEGNGTYVVFECEDGEADVMPLILGDPVEAKEQLKSDLTLLKKASKPAVVAKNEPELIVRDEEQAYRTLVMATFYKNLYITDGAQDSRLRGTCDKVLKFFCSADDCERVEEAEKRVKNIIGPLQFTPFQ